MESVAQNYLDENLMQVALSQTQIVSQRADNDDGVDSEDDEDENFEKDEKT